MRRRVCGRIPARAYGGDALRPLEQMQQERIGMLSKFQFGVRNGCFPCGRAANLMKPDELDAFRGALAKQGSGGDEA